MVSNLRLLLIATCVVLLIPACDDKAPSTDPKCDTRPSDCTLALTLSPGPTTYTNGAVAIKVDVTPPEQSPKEIQLSRNGHLWLTLRAPFRHTWSTANDPEGTYQIVATATSGGRDVTSNPISIVVDRTAPTVQLTPADGSTNVSLSDPITLKFSEPVDPASVSSDTIIVKHADTNVVFPTEWTLSADNRILSLTILDRSSVWPLAYIVGISSGAIRDPAGNVVVVPTWHWTAPLWVKLPSLAGHAPSLAMGPDGKPMVSYLKSQAGDGRISVARYASGSTWASDIGAPTPELVTSTTIAVDGTGNAVIAWSGKDDHVYTARQSSSSWAVFGTAVDGALPSGVANVKSIALDAQGSPVIGITHKAAADVTPIGYAVRWSGGQWQTLPPMGYQYEANPIGPLVAIDSTGALLAWTDGEVHRYTGGMWHQTVVGFHHYYSTFALDSEDHPMFAVERNTGNSLVLSVDILVDGLWQHVGPSLRESQTQVGEAHIAAVAGRNPVIVWTWDTGRTQELRVARYTGQEWDLNFGTLLGSNVDGSRAAHAQVVLDAQGSPTVAWDEYDTVTKTTYVYVLKGNF